MKKINILMFSVILTTTHTKYIECKGSSSGAANFGTIMPSFQEQSLIDQFMSLADSGIANISVTQIAAIPTWVIPFITSNNIQQFTSTQIAAFTPAQIAAFTPAQIANFTAGGTNSGTNPNQMSAFTSTQVAAFTPAQIAAMSKNQLNVIISLLSPTQIQALDMNQIQNLSASALIPLLANLTDKQIDCITPLQINGLGTSVTPLISDLLPAQFLSLSAPQIQTMTNQHINDQISNLSSSMMANLLPAQIATITTAQINLMTKPQLATLQGILTNSTIITTANNPSLAAQIAAIAVAPGKGTQQVVVAKKAKKKLKGIKASNAAFLKAFGG